MHIPYQSIAPDTLRNMLEEYVTRDGTDYGTREYSMEEKVAQLMKQLAAGDVVIEFDENMESIDLVSIK